MDDWSRCRPGSQPPWDPEVLSPALPEVIAECLLEDPRERPSSAAEILRRLYPEGAPLDERPSRWQLRQDAAEVFEQGDLESARDAWNAIYLSEQRDLWSLNNLGVVLSRLGQGSDAVEKFRLAARQMPDSAVIATNFAWALHESGGSKKEALKSLDRAVELDSTYARAFYLRGLYRGGHLAIGDFVEALWLDPAQAEIYLALADELDAAEQFDAAQLRREQAAQCSRPPGELWPELILEEEPTRWTGGENWPPSPAPFGEDFEVGDGGRGNDDDGGTRVPRRRPPHAPSASEAKALPHPYEFHRHDPRYLRLAR